MTYPRRAPQWWAALVVLMLVAGGCATGDTRNETDSGPRPDAQRDHRTTDGLPPDVGEPCPAGGCDDGKACTDDACVAGKCEYTVKAGVCLIDGSCRASGDKDGECNVCAPDQAAKAWTPQASLCADDGKSCTTASCKAGKCEQAITTGFCLIAGSCFEDGKAPSGEECQACDSKLSQTALSPRQNGTACTADTISCTDDICQSGKCEHPINSNSCLIGGQCYQAGAAQAGVDCATCQPSKSTTAWSTAPDNSSCTADALSCTDDVCQSGQCKHPVKSTACLINGQCKNDGDADPAAECMACNPAVAQDAYSAKASGQPCSADSLSCTNDVCQAGSCLHLLASTSCLIGGVCYGSGDTNPQAPCQHCDPVQHAGTWTQKSPGAACTADSLSCTDDVCNAAGTCTHPLKTNSCLINGTCYGDGAPNPADSCSTCQPSKSTAAFMPASDGTLCATDNLPCTNDVCRSGSCKHELAPDRCIINGGCYSVDAATDSTGCNICAPTVSTSAATFAAGKACNDGNASTALDTCLGTSCKGFSAYQFELTASDTDTALNAIAAFSGGGGTWVAGQRKENPGGVTGFIAKLGSTSLSDISAGGGALRAISDRLAVGEGGEAAYWDGTNWYIAGDVMTHVGTARLNGVYGALVSGTRTFFIVGDNGTLSRCTTGDNGVSFACQSVGSLPATTDLAAISGLATGSAIGPLWSVRGETAEDIFYSASGVSWSTSGPQGCLDGATTACGNTTGRLLDVWARNATDVWAVGEKGLILHFDGTSWQKITIPNLGAQSPQSAFTLRGVFGSGDAVVFVGERIWNATDHDMIVMFYNRVLDRWFAPLAPFGTTVSDPHVSSYRFNDVGGFGVDSLGIVGSVYNTTDSEQRGLYLSR